MVTLVRQNTVAGLRFPTVVLLGWASPALIYRGMEIKDNTSSDCLVPPSCMLDHIIDFCCKTGFPLYRSWLVGRP